MTDTNGITGERDWVIRTNGVFLRIVNGTHRTTVADGIISEANARLIASAPELLEALQGLLSRYVELVNSGDAGFWEPENEPQVIAARAAIAKATRDGGAA